MIEVKDLTLTYPGGKGVFGLNFRVREGDSMGYLGPNGSGKTTTIRALMGFMRPDSGTAAIDGMDCWSKSPAILKSLGYIPGEMSFMDGMSGGEYLRFMLDMRGVRQAPRLKPLLEMFELDPRGRIRKYSKGTKQKLGIVAAFMHDPQVLVLDEPSSGLDPLMQNRFVELILSEKKKGKTILMSSHMFEEVERTCGNIAIIRDGRIVEHSDVQTLKANRRKAFLIKPNDGAAAAGMLSAEGFKADKLPDGRLEITVTGEDMDRFIKAAARCALSDLDVKSQTLEDVFMQYYGKGGTQA